MMRKLLIVIFLALALPAYAKDTASEEELKAAFIFQFMNFVEWNDDRPDYYVCIPDDQSLKQVAQQSFDSRVVNHRKIMVVDHADSCHIMVSDPAPDTDTTLTIGSLKTGALFEFRTINNKLKFAVNLERVKRSKFKISSQLLKLAIIEKGS